MCVPGPGPSRPDLSIVCEGLNTTSKEMFAYRSTDISAFKVFVQPLQSKTSANCPSIHEWSPSIKLFSGKFLVQNSIKGVKYIKRKGRNRLSVEFRSVEEANNFISDSIISSKYDANIPSHFVTCQCAIRSVDVFLSVEDILLIVNNYSKVLKVHRLSRRTSEAAVFPTVFSST